MFGGTKDGFLTQEQKTPSGYFSLSYENPQPKQLKEAKAYSALSSHASVMASGG